VNNVLSLRYGLCSITVQAYDEVAVGYLAGLAQRCPSWLQAGHQSASCRLTVLSAHTDGIVEPKWRAIATAWAQARHGLREPGRRSLTAWRALYGFGELLDPHLFLFQDRDSGVGSLFCLVPGDTLTDSSQGAGWVMKAVEAVVIHWLTPRRGALVHASGVARRGKGYLFLGPSGAGKTTVADLSQQAQGAIVHEDHVMVTCGHSGDYRLSHPDSHASPSLRAVFLLRQSQTDHIAPLKPQDVCAGLFKGVREYAVGQKLFGPWAGQAFHNVATMARSVPGYELCFRRSPEFWNVIDAELGS